MKPYAKLAPALLILLALASIQASAAVKPGDSFENAGALDLSAGEAVVEGSLTAPLQENHYYLLRGLGSGMKVAVEVTLRGISSAHVTVSLYSSSRARLTGYDAALGTGNVKNVTLSYVLAYSPGENRTLYLRIGKSRGALNYTAQISIEYLYDYDMQSMRDAGASADQALKVPGVSANLSQKWIGYLSSSGEGEDYEDYYRFAAELSPGDVLHVQLTPSRDLRIRATLYSQDLFPLKTNQSEIRGQPINLAVSGEWKNKAYVFYLAVDNLGGTGGAGDYTVKAWIETKQPQSQQTQTIAETPGGVEESALKFGIIAAAVALIAISIVALILRRRRIYRVEEVGWWGGGETW